MVLFLYSVISPVALKDVKQVTEKHTAGAKNIIRQLTAKMASLTSLPQSKPTTPTPYATIAALQSEARMVSRKRDYVRR